MIRCTSCFKETTISPCIECKTLAVTEKNNKILSQQASDLANQQQADRWRQREIDQANELSRTLQLAELQKQTLLIEEASITLNEAYNEGYSWAWISNNPKALENSLDEEGTIVRLNFKYPYISPRLQKKFNEGVWDRLRKEVGYNLKMSSHEMAKSAYKYGLDGKEQFTVYQSAPFLKGKSFSLDVKYDVYDSTVLSSGEYVINLNPSFANCDSPNTFKIGYLMGVIEYIKKFTEENNTEELMKQRVTDRLEMERAAKVETFWLVIFIIVSIIAAVCFVYFAPWWWTVLVLFLSIVWFCCS